MVGRRRLKISRAWEMDGYRMAEAMYYADENPAPNSPEAAQLAQLATSVEALADQWVDRVKCVTILLRTSLELLQAATLSEDLRLHCGLRAGLPRRSWAWGDFHGCVCQEHHFEQCLLPIAGRLQGAGGA